MCTEEGMGAYGVDLRERVLRAMEAGASVEEAAKRYGVHRSTAWRYRKRQEETGERKARPSGGRRPSRFEGHDAVLLRWANNQSTTLAELVVKCREELGIRAVPQTILNRLRKLGMSHKKKPSGVGTKSARR